MNIRKSITLLSATLLIAPFIHGQELKGKDKKMLSQLKTDIAYLASDELKGRATGTEGEKLSAEYIADAFAKNKLKPAGENGYFQNFTITTLRIADGGSELNFNGNKLTLYKDFYPLSYSTNQAEVNTAVVDAGFGIVNDIRNDYEKIYAKERIVMINLGSPDGIHPHSKFLAWHGIKIRVDQAIKQGASAVIFYRSKESVEKPSGELSLTMEPCNIPVLFVDQVVDSVGSVKFASVKINVLTAVDTAYNVIGFKDNGAKHTIVIGAHHDHLGQGQHGNSLAEHPDEIHNGADDNASGSAALISLSKRLKKVKSWSKENNYLFIAFSGEEMGLLGSKYYVNHPTIDLSTVNYMINMDMIGMLNEEKVLIINGVGTSPAFQESINEMNEGMQGISSVTVGNSGIGPSDHTSFYLAGIPSIHYFTGAHEHYHKPTDDVERLNYEGEVYIVKYILNMIETLSDNGKLEYTKTKDESKDGKSRTKFEVTLGVVPNYAFNGEGMQIDAVREGKPGEAAGMKAKDVVVSFAGMNIASMGDYMKALGTLKKGDKTTVGVLRDGKLINLEVQF